MMQCSPQNNKPHQSITKTPVSIQDNLSTTTTVIKSRKTLDSISSGEISNVIRDMYKWYLTKGIKQADFDYYENDTIYTAINIIALKKRLNEMKQTDLFSEIFLNNYRRIALKIDYLLKYKLTEYAKGNMPPFGSDASP
jgi:hypothetical protein